MTRADLKHCGKIPDAREELNRSMREGRIESRHSIKSLEAMGSSSHDLGAELRMYFLSLLIVTLFQMKKKLIIIIIIIMVIFKCYFSGELIALS